MKKMIALALSLVLCLACLGMGCAPKAKRYRVGICQLTQHEALDAATAGFKQALIDILGEDGVEFDEQNASGDSATCSTIVNSFVSKRVDLILANATPALQAAYSATETIPVLGTAITEYSVALGLTNYNGTVGGNISGTSDLAPLDQQAEIILSLFPEAKNIGLLYCSAEANSEYQVKFMEDFFAGKGLTTTRFAFSDSNDVAAVTRKAAAGCDVLFIPTDNTAASCVGVIGSIIKEAKLPCICGEVGLCKECGVATLSISYYDLGYKTGEMAAKILKGEADISTMAIEYAPATKMFNKEICDLLGIKIPDGFEEIK